MKKLKTNKIDYESIDFPEKLKHVKPRIKNLYYIGSLPDPKKKTVAIVGARSASDYGLTLGKNISKILSENDVQVISGMAMGIDTSGHMGAVEVSKPTFAVLGSGVDICYPTYNYHLYEKIIEDGGGIISEYENGTPPLSVNFPARNRIISGFADAVLVVEAREKSGSLITADFALEQGKSIFAAPGRIGDSLSKGTNNLIKQGAYILTSADDILSFLGLVCDGILPKKTINIDNLDYYEKVVYKSLNETAKHIDKIIEETKLPVTKCLNILMSLELEGLIESTVPNYYKRIDLKLVV